MRKASRNEKPLVSVITVVFNDGGTIEQTIKNVTSQDYPNLEYIIVDGGSTDNTLDIIRKYEDRIDYWISEKDNGIYDAMNKGVGYATGEWVNFMNAGDSFYEATMISEVMSNIPLDADLVYGHTYYRENDKLTLIETYDISCIWMSMICSHQSIFAKTDLLREHPFDLRYAISSDFDFVYHAYTKKRRFFDTKKVIAVHAVDGVSEQRIIKRMMERWRIVNHYTPSMKVNMFYAKLFLKKIKRAIGKNN